MYRDSGFGFSFAITPMVRRLLIANGVAFLVTWLVGEGIVFDAFGLQPRRLLVRPWGVGTYMFVHAGFWHLFSNMLMLFFFGPPLESRWGSREFLRFYLISGLGGAALSLLVLPGMVVGASAAVYGVMLAFAMNWPNASIYVYGIIPVKAKWLVAFLLVVTLAGTFDSTQSSIAHAAHLGGIVAAFLYLKADWRPGAAWQKLRGAKRRQPRAPRPLAIVPRDLRETGNEQAEVATKPEAGPRRSSRPTPDERAMLDEVDRVLDKISAQGMSSLTRAERRLLDEVSRSRRSN